MRFALKVWVFNWKNPMTDQDFWKGRFSQPDMAEVQNPFDPKRRVWTRSHGKRCAQCGDNYFDYMPEDAYWQPYQVDPEPRIAFGWSTGLRGTCGSTACKLREESHQLNRSPAYQESVQAERTRRGMGGGFTGSGAPLLKKLE